MIHSSRRGLYLQALKLKRNDWRLWSNYVVAAMRMKNYQRAIYGMNQLLKMKYVVSLALCSPSAIQRLCSIRQSYRLNPVIQH